MLHTGSMPYAVNIYPNTPSMKTVSDHWNGNNIIFPQHDIFYIIAGGIVMNYGGKSYIVPEGHAVYIPKNTPFTCWSIRETALTYIEFLLKAELDNAEIFSKFYIDTQNPVIELPKNRVMEIYNATKHFSAENIPQRINVCTQLMKFLTLLYTAFSQRKETERLYGDVLHLMRARLSEEIKLESLAALRNADPGYFSKKFKETAGVSPQHFLSRLRLWHAATLLKNEDVTPHYAAAAIGFSDVYYFKTFFKNFFGVPPESYKKIFREPRYINVKKEEKNAKS